MHHFRAQIMATLAAGMLSAFPVHADEGLWLFNNLPRKALKVKYDFDPDQAWLDRVQRASVRFNSGGSGSFVSADGLVMTNHHVGADCLQKLSTPDKDLVATGFHARKREDEVKCVDLELNVLQSIEDVTDRVNAAVKPEMSAAEAHKARVGAINVIEKESLDKTGQRSDVVTLYKGGAYHLYRYKKYTDVRLVFAPEKDIAFYGGDPDNFEYPRYDLDICFFRVYEDGKPAKIKDYLKWSASGAENGELVFVSGHPGRTERQDTLAHVRFLRDVDFPHRLNVIRRREVALRTFSDRHPENARRAMEDLFSYQNSRKARLGMLAGLQDPAFMKRKEAAEKALRERVENDPKLAKEYGGAWDEIDKALQAWRPIYHEHYLLERGVAFNTDLFQIARNLVRLAEESKKKDADRLREFASAGLESLKMEMFSEAPIYDDLETLKLADSLGMLIENLGADNAMVRSILDGRSPQERAAQLIAGSKLKDVKVRKALSEGGLEAIEASTDPMIQLALLVDPAARKVRKTFESQVEEPLRQAYAKIARARFAAFGKDVYPDATFTLRLSYGVVKGYKEDGRDVPWATDFGGLYKYADAHQHKEPFVLPPSWKKGQGKLKMATPFNFVATVDIIGGNSGSPVINRAGELVGIIFDGNIQSLVWDFEYTDTQARSVAVHSAGILEALRKIYGADELVRELTR
jgi:hypothetical protein